MCVNCKRSRYSLNNDTIKVCLKKNNLPEEFELMKIDNYLQKYINADPHFFFSKVINEIKATIDSPDWGKSFLWKGNYVNIIFLF